MHLSQSKVCFFINFIKKKSIELKKITYRKPPGVPELEGNTKQRTNGRNQISTLNNFRVRAVFEASLSFMKNEFYDKKKKKKKKKK